MEDSPRVTIASACPSCGDFAGRETYDIGDGPELCCASCDWCWGAEGQPLSPLRDRNPEEPWKL